MSGLAILKAISKYKTGICVGTAIASSVGGAILAGRGAVKVKPVIESHKEEMAKIDETKRIADESGKEYTEQDIRKDKLKVWGKTALGVSKCFGGSVACEILSITCVGMLGKDVSKTKKALAETSAGLASILGVLANYRSRVIDEEGEEKDRHYLLGSKIETSTIEEEVVDPKTGKTKKVKKEVKTPEFNINVDTDNGFIFYFSRLNSDGSINPEWDIKDNRDIMIHQIQARQNTWNDLLNANKDVIWLNDVVRDLGMKPTVTGQFLKWTYKPGRTISFGIDEEELKMFRDGEIDGLFMIFNVDGSVGDDGKWHADINFDELEEK